MDYVKFINIGWNFENSERNFWSCVCIFVNLLLMLFCCRCYLKFLNYRNFDNFDSFRFLSNLGIEWNGIKFPSGAWLYRCNGAYLALIKFLRICMHAPRQKMFSCGIVSKMQNFLGQLPDLLAPVKKISIQQTHTSPSITNPFAFFKHPISINTLRHDPISNNRGKKLIGRTQTAQESKILTWRLIEIYIKFEQIYVNLIFFQLTISKWERAGRENEGHSMVFSFVLWCTPGSSSLRK